MMVKAGFSVPLIANRFSFFNCTKWDRTAIPDNAWANRPNTFPVKGGHLPFKANRNLALKDAEALYR